MMAPFSLALTSPAAYAAAVDAPAKVSPEDPSELSLKFGYDGNSPVITVSFKAPSREKSYTGEGAPLTTNLDKIEINRRVKGTYNWAPVHTFTNVAPGTPLTYVDRDIEEGVTYEYNPLAYIGEDTSSTWSYEEVYAGIRPSAPKVTAETFKGGAPVTLTIVAPSTLEDGDPIDMQITELQITRSIGWEDFSTIHTIANPTAGQTYTWTDEDYKNLIDGVSVNYEVFAKIGNFSSTAGSATVILKKDIPAAPATVKAVEENGGVKVTWDPVTTGAQGYWFDPAEVTYNVYRVSQGGAVVTLATELDECTYFDNLEDITTMNSYAWKVTAVNAQGEGYGNESAYMTLGPAATLPFAETFNTPGGGKPTTDNLWTSESVEGWYTFNVENEVYFWGGSYDDLYIYGLNNDGGSDKSQGFLAFEGSSWSATEALFTSTQLETGRVAKAKLSFFYYVIPQSKSTLHVELVDPDAKGGASTDANASILANITMDGDELGWKECVIENIDLTSYDSFQIRLHAVTDPDDGRQGLITPICIDNISMEATEKQAGMESVAEGTVVATEYYDLQGRKVANPEKGSIVIMRQKMENGTYRHSKVRI